MASLNPSKSFKAFKVEDLMRLDDSYPSEFPKHELGFFREQLMNYINDVYLILKLALIFPVAITTVECAFSAMKLIKNDLRNKLGDQFMNDYLLTCIEKDVLDGISNDAIMDEFFDMKPHRQQ
ncbi:uncharacterized protein [Rutidosis leptorrhynchoides]|uniref:uncharacterized protein n=1 Tax=Rutidosis leptorrhynchoides TaxID=125765 RepID=UPI003A9A109C